MNKKYQKISEETIHKNPWWSYKHDVYTCDEKECHYYYGEFIGTAIVVPILDDGRIALVRQYRYLQSKSGVEFPMGGMEEGETPLQAATKELFEEAGMESSNFSKVGEFANSKGVLKSTSHVFLANEIFNITTPKLEDTEDIEVLLRRPDEVDKMIRGGEIWDSQTLATWSLVRDLLIKK